MRDRAWKYVNYSLAYDHDTCDAMLEALASTAFAAAGDFAAFKMASRAKYASCRDDKGWDSLYRHVHEDGQTCLVSSVETQAHQAANESLARNLFVSLHQN